MADDLLKVEGLNQYYGGSHILRNLGFDAKQGEVTVVLGRNGVGKTTMVKTIMGLVTLSAGRVAVGDTDITGWPPHLVARAGGHRRIAVLGEMAELGIEAPVYHREIGELVRRLGIEQVIAVGDLARAYGGAWVPSAVDAATKLRAALRPGDVVLVKGSRSVGLEAVAENLSP